MTTLNNFSNKGKILLISSQNQTSKQNSHAKGEQENHNKQKQTTNHQPDVQELDKLQK